MDLNNDLKRSLFLKYNPLEEAFGQTWQANLQQFNPLNINFDLSRETIV